MWQEYFSMANAATQRQADILRESERERLAQQVIRATATADQPPSGRYWSSTMTRVGARLRRVGVDATPPATSDLTMGCESPC